MSLAAKLHRWTETGLITADQAAAIQTHEHERGRPTFLYAIAGLGGLAIGIGLVSIVASNWDAIPGRLKVGIAVGLVAAAGAGVVRLDRSGPRWALETAVLVAHGLVLATIALVGQVYQLGGAAHTALSLWLALTTLLVTRARGAVAAWVFIASAEATYGAWVVEFVEGFDVDELLALGAMAWAPLGCLAAGFSAGVIRTRPSWASALRAAGWGQLVLLASLATVLFYEGQREPELGGLYTAAGVGVALALAIAAVHLRQTRARRTGALLLAACVALIYVPGMVSDGDMDLVGALTFLALWVLVALAAFRAGRLGLLNLATAVIGVRLLIVYFEVFGSLLNTGLGLVSGGLLTIGLVWLWTRKRRDFGEELAGEAP